jgi:hypothetical protein
LDLILVFWQIITINILFMKICFVGSGGVGHIRPTLGLVKALVDAGHQVDYWVECLFGNSQAKSLEQAGANYFDIPDQFGIPDLIRCISIFKRYIGLWAGLKTFASLAKDPYATIMRIKAMDTKLFYEFVFTMGFWPGGKGKNSFLMKNIQSRNYDLIIGDFASNCRPIAEDLRLPLMVSNAHAINTGPDEPHI